MFQIISYQILINWQTSTMPWLLWNLDHLREFSTPHPLTTPSFFSSHNFLILLGFSHLSGPPIYFTYFSTFLTTCIQLDLFSSFTILFLLCSIVCFFNFASPCSQQHYKAFFSRAPPPTPIQEEAQSDAGGLFNKNSWQRWALESWRLSLNSSTHSPVAPVFFFPVETHFIPWFAYWKDLELCQNASEVAQD